MFAEALALAAQAPSGASLAEACRDRSGWTDPAPPALIHGQTYYVGTCGLSAILIASPKGHVLIDGTTAEGAPLIAANIRRLGFRVEDVKLILSSHEHLDHAGGIAALKRMSGAKVAALAAAAPLLQSGTPAPDDPQAGSIASYPGVRVDRVLRDGEQVRVGPIRLTAYSTPGHSPGGASWSWRSCEKRRCLTIVYADSVSAVSAPGYRFTDHPERQAALRGALARIGALDCDLLMTPHPVASGLWDRLAGSRPLVDPTGCRTYAAAGSAALDKRLADEAGR